MRTAGRSAGRAQVPTLDPGCPCMVAGERKTHRSGSLRRRGLRGRRGRLDPASHRGGVRRLSVSRDPPKPPSLKDLLLVRHHPPRSDPALHHPHGAQVTGSSGPAADQDRLLVSRPSSSLPFAALRSAGRRSWFSLFPAVNPIPEHARPRWRGPREPAIGRTFARLPVHSSWRASEPPTTRMHRPASTASAHRILFAALELIPTNLL